MKRFLQNRILRLLCRTMCFPFIRMQLKRDLARLPKNVCSRSNNEDVKVLTIAYIRSDFWLHAQSSNGAMAHTIGVVNALKKLCKEVIVYSICKITYLAEDIEQNVCAPKGCAVGISELQEVEYSHYLAKKLYPHMRANKPSFIYQRYGRNNYTGVLLAKWLNIPCVMEYNGSELWMADHWGGTIRYRKLTEEIELAVFNAADLIVGNAQALKDELIARGINSSKIVIIPNGVDTDKFSPANSGAEVREKYHIAKDDIVVSFVGSFGPWHGADVLAKAVKNVIEHNKHVRFMFVGNGGGLSKVQDIIHIDNMEGHVVYTGAVKQNEAPFYVAASDILVSPQIPNPDGTSFFGSPTKLFEYMASGKAIVASNLDQMGQILTHNQTALLTTPGSADEIADCILTLAKDERLRRTLGMNAREEVCKKYTWDIHVQKIIETLYSKSKKM